MLFRPSLVAVAALLGAVAFAVPAAAIEQIHIPDASAAQNSGPPDALFDKSMPTTWQKKSEEKQQQSNFHFTVSGGSGQSQSSSGAADEARVPGSEFHQNGAVDPYSPR